MLRWTRTAEGYATRCGRYGIYRDRGCSYGEWVVYDVITGWFARGHTYKGVRGRAERHRERTVRKSE